MLKLWMNRFLHLGSFGICKALALCEGHECVDGGKREVQDQLSACIFQDFLSFRGLGLEL